MLDGVDVHFLLDDIHPIFLVIIFFRMKNAAAKKKKVMPFEKKYLKFKIYVKALYIDKV